MFIQTKLKEKYATKLRVFVMECPQLCVLSGAVQYGLKPDNQKIQYLSLDKSFQNHTLNFKFNNEISITNDSNNNNNKSCLSKKIATTDHKSMLIRMTFDGNKIKSMINFE
jgi:hypothetical protein